MFAAQRQSHPWDVRGGQADYLAAVGHRRRAEGRQRPLRASYSRRRPSLTESSRRVCPSSVVRPLCCAAADGRGTDRHKRGRGGRRISSPLGSKVWRPRLGTLEERGSRNRRPALRVASFLVPKGFSCSSSLTWCRGACRRQRRASTPRPLCRCTRPSLSPSAYRSRRWCGC
jgi:hypothetical protein